MESFESLPQDLPRPIDDGKCDHLMRNQLPSVSLFSHHGHPVNLSEVQESHVIYFYPMIGVPGKALPDGWNEMPGARGCTPESCGFRDSFEDFSSQGIRITGISSQATTEQREAAKRLRLPLDLLSDNTFELTDALQLPTFEKAGRKFIRRLTLFVTAGRIQRVFYPVFPPDRHAAELLELIKPS